MYVTIIFEVVGDVVAHIKDMGDSQVLQDSFILGMYVIA